MRALYVPVLLLGVACGGDDDETIDTTDAVEPGPFTASMGTADCQPSAALKPPTGQAGTWVATRLAPPGYPARIDSIEAVYDSRVPCTLGEPSIVRVFVGGETPDANPGVFASSAIEPASGSGAPQAISLDVSDVGTVLQEGEYLYVQVQLSGRDGASRCATLCQINDRTDEAFFSGTNENPFSWSPVSDTGVVGAVAASMSGEVLAQ